jgi:hypothetical protein
MTKNPKLPTKPTRAVGTPRVILTKGADAIAALAALASFETLKPISLTDDDLRLVKWLIAGHPNEKDEDVQALRAKAEHILEDRKIKRLKARRPF